MNEEDRVREILAEWLFKNTDWVYWDLCGYDLSESITEYKYLVTLPEGFDFDDEDIERIKQMHEDLLSGADQILKIKGLHIEADDQSFSYAPCGGDNESYHSGWKNCRKAHEEDNWVKVIGGSK